MNLKCGSSLILAGLVLVSLPAVATACDQSTMYPRSWNEACEGKIVPNEVFLSASVSASGNQMVHNREELKRQIEEIRKIAGSMGGELVLKDLNRNFAEVMNNGYSMIPGAPTKSFVATQAFEIVVQKSTDIDALVDKLNALGTVNFGRSVGYNDGRMKSFVRYRATDAVAQLDKLTESCKAKAIAQGCRSAPEGEKKCVESLAKEATIQNFNLASQSVATEFGQYNPITLYYPGQTSQLSNLELNGDITLNFSGSITVQSLPSATPVAVVAATAQMDR